ncbi:MAG: hypothetical protein ABSH44_18950 [Bryobacteraceae bacterium]|jgi:hypothetical protein
MEIAGVIADGVLRGQHGKRQAVQRLISLGPRADFISAAVTTLCNQFRCSTGDAFAILRGIQEENVIATRPHDSLRLSGELSDSERISVLQFEWIAPDTEV